MKNRTSKRIISLVLVIMIIASLVTVATVSTGAATAFTVELKQDEFTYNAKLQYPQIAKMNVGKATISSDEVSLIGTLFARNAGEYSFTVAITNPDLIHIGYFGKTCKVTWKINKAEVTPSITLQPWTYGEEPNEPVIENNPSKGEIKKIYSGVTVAGENFYSEEEPPTEAGDYVLTIVIAADKNYEEFSDYVEFSIAQQEVALDWSNLTLIYNGKNQKPTVEIAGGLDIPVNVTVD